jgi:hypothetical protein
VGDEAILALWREALAQALQDAQSRRAGTLFCPEHIVLSARRWLAGARYAAVSSAPAISIVRHRFRPGRI